MCCVLLPADVTAPPAELDVSFEPPVAPSVITALLLLVVPSVVDVLFAPEVALVALVGAAGAGELTAEALAGGAAG